MSAELPYAMQVVALLNERYKVGDELKRSIRDDILRLIEAKTYRCGITYVADTVFNTHT
jgi:ribosomal protein S13